ncbi:hypothetical protein BVRB_4g081760 [Beta vulgaris subsp. vulgaris]|nr:hypothetical protein BVRB_4g081760 [Beta vulgaris subsp. vulgaris]
MCFDERFFRNLGFLFGCAMFICEESYCIQRILNTL